MVLTAEEVYDIEHHRRFYLRGRGGLGPPMGGGNIIRRKGIMVYGCRVCVRIDERKPDEQLLSSLYYPSPTVIIEWVVLYFYPGSSFLLS